VARWGPPVVVMSELLVLLVGSNLPTPLYAGYREEFGFSTGVLALIFSSYAFALIAALIVFGRLSDQIGRRPVILAGLALAAIAAGLFALASGTAWLFAARIVQGAAVGIVTGAAVAALVELDPAGDRGRAALLAALGTAGGCAVGPPLAGALAQWAPEPHVLCYLVQLAVTLLVGLAVLAIPEPGVRDPGASGWDIQRPSVPPAIRAEFARAGAAGGTVWSVAALFLSIVPSYAADLLGSDNLAVLGAVAGLMLAASCVAQVALRGLAPGTAQAGGLALLAVGLGALVVAFPLHSLAVLVAAAVIAGAGHGAGFLGAQTNINHAAPSDRRGEVSAAFFVCVYIGAGVPVIGVGFLSGPLSLFAAVATYAAASGAAALFTAVWTVRSRQPVLPGVGT
jgi:predicted MFS family arabinose efflux permease